MKAYKIKPPTWTTLNINASTEGETLEQKLERIINNKEPLEGDKNKTAPIIYTERKEGVRPSTNIRTDRFEIALEASEKIQKSYSARRAERIKRQEDGESKPVQSDPPEGTPKGE